MDPNEAAPSKAPIVGRRIGLLVFWLGIAYMLVVSFATLLPPIFFPEDSGDLATAGECRELLSTNLQTLTATGSPLDDFSWKRQRVACGEHTDPSLRRAHVLLGRLRQRHEEHRARATRRESSLREELHEILGSTPTPPQGT